MKPDDKTLHGGRRQNYGISYSKKVKRIKSMDRKDEDAWESVER